MPAARWGGGGGWTPASELEAPLEQGGQPAVGEPPIGQLLEESGRVERGACGWPDGQYESLGPEPLDDSRQRSAQQSPPALFIEVCAAVELDDDGGLGLLFSPLHGGWDGGEQRPGVTAEPQAGSARPTHDRPGDLLIDFDQQSVG